MAVGRLSNKPVAGTSCVLGKSPRGESDGVTFTGTGPLWVRHPPWTGSPSLRELLTPGGLIPARGWVQPLR